MSIRPRQRLVHLAGHSEDALDDLLFAAHLTLGEGVYATHLFERMMSLTCSVKGSAHVNASETALRTCRESSSSVRSSSGHRRRPEAKAEEREAWAKDKLFKVAVVVCADDRRLRRASRRG